MNLIGTTALTYYRRSPGTWSNGFYTNGSESPFSFSASVQPKLPDTRILQVEGQRQKQAYLLYTETELKTVEESTSNTADEVEIDGVRFVVTDVKYWRDLFPHYQVTVTKIDNKSQDGG